MSANPQSLAALVYTPMRKGSLPLDMLGGARRRGALAVGLPENASAVFAEVAAGRPVIVLQNLSLPIYPLWHYTVVVGYDLNRSEVILRSGRKAREVLPLRTFEHTWARSGHWAMLAPGELAVGDGKQAYVEAAVALERLGHHNAARRGYEAGIKRWPLDLALLMGAGNTAYAMGDRHEAEIAFRQAVDAHPDSAAALNNLAHVLAERDALDEAFALARRALTVSSRPHHTAALATLGKIEGRRQARAATSH